MKETKIIDMWGGFVFLPWLELGMEVVGHDNTVGLGPGPNAGESRVRHNARR